MKRNMYLVLALVFTAIIMLCPCAFASEIADFTYTVSNGAVTITKYTGSDAEVEIPAFIDDTPVTAIGADAFEYNQTVVSIVVPDGVTYIGLDAFAGCPALETVVLPDSVETLWSYTFRDCTSLTSVNYPLNWNNTGNSGSYRYETPFKNCPNFKSITVPEGVTAIPVHAFDACVSLEEIVLPSTLETISSEAFRNAAALKAIEIPESVTSIGASAFYGCKSLTELTVPGSIATISDSAFEGCSALEKLTVNEGVTSINYRAFHNCTALKDVTLPEGLITIGLDAFNTCTSLESIVIPDSVETVWSYSFNNCTSLTSINYPLNWKNTGTSGSYRYETPFKNCPNLKSMTVPEGVTAIPVYAFDNCVYLETISLPTTLETIGTEAFQSAKALKALSIPESVTTIGNHAFNGCTSLEAVAVPGSVTLIDDAVFYGCTSLKKLVLEEGVQILDYQAFNGCSALTDVTLPESLRVIGHDAFRNCPSLESIVIPEGVETIWSYCFENCTALANVNYPKSWVNTGYSGSYRYETPFKNCPNLKSIEVPEGVTAIPVYAFDNCVYLETISLPTTLETIGTEAFQGATALKVLSIPESVTTIGNHAFNGCTSLEEVVVPGSVTLIDDAVFYGCTSLKKLVLEEGVEILDYQAFNGCSALTDVTLPESLRVLGRDAFRNCPSLESIVIPEGVETIWSYCFENCTALANVNYPKSWVNTGYSGSYRYETPFKNCPNLKSMTVPEGVTAIPTYAFSACASIEEIVLPSTLETIGSETFQNATALKVIEIPESVTSIGNNAFYNCKSLKEITIPGSVVTIPASAFQNCTGLAKLVVEEGVTTIGEWAFNTCTSLTDVSLPEGLLIIGRNTFSSCTSLQTIDLPDSLETVWSYSFAACTNLSSVNYPLNWKNTGTSGSYRYTTPFTDCPNLKSMTVPEGVTAIPTYAFNACASLEEIVLPSTLETIGSETFQNATALKVIEIPESVTSIGNNAFYNCKSLKEITIPGSVATIPANAFQNCTGLAKLVVEEGVTTIGEWAFNTCTSLTDVSLPEGLLIIGRNTFSSCTSLQTIDLPDSLETVWSYSFAACTNLSSVNYPLNWKNTGTSGSYRYTTPFTDTSVTSIDIPEGVTAIPEYAFKDSKLEQVWMPKTLESFGGETFANCSGMTAYVWSGSPIHYVVEGMADFTFELRDPHEHEFWKYGDATADCEKDGVQMYQCSLCPYFKSEKIAAYGHDFGMWKTEIPATFIQQGLKVRECTRCGLREEETLPRLDPGDSDDFCDATFRVVNAETLEPISGAHLSVYCYEEGEITITTDANGYANETLPVGKWMVSAYASGMKVRNLVINVQAGEHTYPDIGLSSKDLVSATLTSKEMTLEEMIAAGIDVSDSSNRHLYKYEVKLEFRPGIDALALSGYGGFGLGMFGGWLPNVGGEEPPTTDDEAPDDGDFEKGPGGPLPYPFWEFEKPQGEGSIHKAVYRGEETITVYPVSEKFLLIIYGEVSWLKEMFDVEMVVINGSMTDTFEDGVAALKLPTGLSLAKMRDDLPQQHLVYDIETLAGGEMQSVHWYVRGDEAGTYNITALLEGLMMPFEEEIYQEYECEDAISVLAGNAMELTYHVPNMAYYGEEYPVVAKLKNVSDKILYNVHHDITGSSQKRITVYSDGSEKPDATFTSVDEWHNAYAKKFYPGQTIEASGHVIIAFESELIKEKLKEIRDYAQKLDEYMAMADAVGDIAGKIDDGIGFLDDVNTLLDEEKLPNEKMDVFKQWASDKGMDAFENELEEYFGDGNVDVSKLTDAVCDFIESIPLQFHLVSSEVVVDPISTTYIPTTIETFPATRDPHVASPDVKVEEMVDAFRQEGNLARSAGSHAEAFGKAVGLNNAVSDLTAVGGVQENITVVPAVSNIACKVWSDKNMLTLAVLGADVYTDETLQFTGGGVLKVIPKESEEVYTDTLYIDNGDDTVYTYNVTVYPKHECACTEKTVLVYPTDATDGLAVSLCDVCEQVLSVEELTSCGAHIFGNYELIIAPEDGMYGIKLRECEECYCYEYMIVDENDLQRIIIGLDPNGGEGEMTCIDVESGNTCILPENGFTYEEMNFICWNTAADGTGTSYLPGDEVTFETACTLYAQWSKTERMDVNLSRAAWSADQMVYDGTEKTVVVEGLPECVEAVYTGNTATEIGEYTAGVTFIYDESIYNEPIMPDHTWKVVPAISFKENLDKVYDGYNVGTAYTLAVDGVVAETFYEKTVTGEGEEAVTEWVELDRSPVNAGEYRLDVQITFGDSDYTAFESVEYTISKRPVTLLADDVITVYNGKPQGGTKVGDNLPDGHSVRAVVIEGEAADAGVYKDVLVPVSAVLTDQYGRIATFNYDIDFQNGDLVIEKRPTVVVADDTMHYYDGKAHGGSTATAYNIVTGHTLADPVIEGEETEIGIYEGKLVPTAVTILDEAGADVTGNYLIEWQAGMLEIRQVFAEQILLSVTAMYADTGDSFTAASTVLPENTTDKGILWTTDNAKIAKVDEQGRVTVIAEGTAKITATAADGSGTIAEFTVEAKDLATIVPPAALTRIDEEAFIESAVEAVDLSAIDGVEIGDRAFADCAALVKIVLPENAAFGADVFSGTEGVVMYCADDSAVDFALENGFGYVLVAEEAQD